MLKIKPKRLSKGRITFDISMKGEGHLASILIDGNKYLILTRGIPSWNECEGKLAKVK